MTKVAAVLSTLMVAATGHAGTVTFDLSGSHIAGAVDVWTKADSVTAFDDFTFQARP